MGKERNCLHIFYQTYSLENTSLNLYYSTSTCGFIVHAIVLTVLKQSS